MTAPPAPNRATMTMPLTMGLVTIPMSWYAGSEDSAFERHQYDAEGRSVGNVSAVKHDDTVLKDVDNTLRVALDAALKSEHITQGQFDRMSKFSLVEKVARGEIIKCVETEHGLVRIDDAEVNNLEFPPEIKRDAAEVMGFLPLSVLGSRSYVPESLYQIRPKKEKGKDNSAAQTSFAYLLKAMRNKAVFALVRMIVRGNVRYGALMSNGRVWMMRFEEEIREDLPLPNFSDLDRDQVRMMGTLIDSMTLDKPPVLDDTATALCWKLVEKKVEAKDIFKPSDVASAPEGAATDLMASLTASVEAARGQS